jgi:hypothetical protein
MGNLLPSGALGRQLTWNDFSRRNNPAPPPGSTASAAETRVTRIISPNQIHFTRTAYLRPPNFKMVEDPDITIQFDTNSWVENWVFTMPMSFQTSLLAHEQGHYDIGSLNAGDFFAELESINGSAFATARGGSTAVQDLRNRLGPVQPIHNKYDRDTNHGLNAGPQAAWTAALANARLPTNTLLGSLSAAGLFP